MSYKKRHIDELFRKALSGHEHQPSPEGWIAVSDGLARRKKKALFISFIRIAATILIILGFGEGLINLFRQHKDEDNYLSADKNVTSPKPEIPNLPAPRQTPNFIDEQEIIAEKLDSHHFAPPGTKESKTREISLPELQAANPVSEISVPKKVFELTSRYPATMITSQPPPRTGPEMKERWLAGVMIAPNYSFRSLSAGDAGEFSMTRFNNHESGLLSISGSFYLSYIINNRFSVQTGLDLLRLGQRIEGLSVIFDHSAIEILSNLGIDFKAASVDPVHSSLGNIHTTQSSLIINRNYNSILSSYEISQPGNSEFTGVIERGKLIQELNYIQVPLIMRYRLIPGNTGVSISGGFGANFLVGNKVMVKNQGVTYDIGQTLNISRFGLTGIIAIGFEHKLTDNIMLMIEPRLSHFISPINPNGYHIYLPYNLSFFGGVSYIF